jgi:hypothetical protein
LDYSMPSSTTSPTRPSPSQQQAAPWSEFVYSAPNSPSNSPQITQHPHQPLAWLEHGNNNNNSNNNNAYPHFDQMVMPNYPIKVEILNDQQRRHSIAVGDLAYHSDQKQQQQQHQDALKFEMNLQHHLPTPPTQQQRTSHNEKSNLHLDMSSKPPQQHQPFTNYSSGAIPSPSTPAFFTSAFLDSLTEGQQQHHAGGRNHTAAGATTQEPESIFSFSMAPSSNSTIQFMNPNDMLAHASPEHMLNDIMAENEDFVFDSSQHHTVAPSALSSDNPFYQQSASPFSDLIIQQHDQPVSQSLHRGSASRSSTSSLASTLQQQHIASNDMNFAMSTMDFGNNSMARKGARLQQISPPASPTHSSSLSNTSSSPSPPITPMLHQQQQQQAYQQGFNDGPTFQHPTIPEEDDEDMLLNQADFAGYLQPNGLDDPLKAKGGIVSARMLQSSNVAQLRPLIRHYLQSPNPAASGERTVVILTSKVAQKSYGTEKR